MKTVSSMLPRRNSLPSCSMAFSRLWRVKSLKGAARTKMLAVPAEVLCGSKEAVWTLAHGSGLQKQLRQNLIPRLQYSSHG